MSNKIVSVIWFGTCGTLIGYAMDRGFAYFSETSDSTRILGYLAVVVSTACSIAGMVSLWRAFTRRSGRPSSGSRNDARSVAS
jgi:hypothetical protein